MIRSFRAISLFGRPFSLLSLLACVLTAACGAPNRTPLPLGANQAAFVRTPRGAGTLSIRVHIPQLIPGRVARSWETRGMTLQFNAAIGRMAFVLEFVNHAQCSGAPLVCTIAVTLPPGKYKPQLTTYTKPPENGVPAGSPLVTVPMFFTVKRGVTSQFDLVLGGDVEQFKVPQGVSYVTVTAGGAGGGDDGKGGLVDATIRVTATRPLTAVAGGKAGGTHGGFNGGGDSNHHHDGGPGFAGSGASDLRLGGSDLTNRVAVAGGGGGNGGRAGSCDGGYGGVGGGEIAASGTRGSQGFFRHCHGLDTFFGRGGRGGSQDAAGAAGRGGVAHGRHKAGAAGENGMFGTGGGGGASYAAGGGGGGGYYGGGGGGGGSAILFAGGGGGGGSSFIGKGATEATSLQGALDGDGFVLIGWY